MPEGNCAAVGVDIARLEPVLDPDLPDRIERLGGKGLVDLEDIDILRRQAGQLQHLGNRVGGPHAHLLGLAPGHGIISQFGEWLESQRLGLLRRHQQRKGGAVGHL